MLILWIENFGICWWALTGGGWGVFKGNPHAPFEVSAIFSMIVFVSWDGSLMVFDVLHDRETAPKMNSLLVLSLLIGVSHAYYTMRLLNSRDGDHPSHVTESTNGTKTDAFDSLIVDGKATD